MKAFTDEQALELGRSILDRFEDGLNGKKWMGRSVVLPFQLSLDPSSKFEYPRDHPWTSTVEMSIPTFIRQNGRDLDDWEHITLDEWLNRKQGK